MKTKLLNTFAIIKAAEKVTGKPAKVIRGSTRVASVVAVRNLCYKVAKEQLNLADRDIAASFGRDRSAVTHSLKRVEMDLAQRGNYRVMLSLIQEELGL
tara:strand:+ start:1013 stop:1309 length:297 start_codon:yes stop_codon:yes gene_type:complete